MDVRNFQIRSEQQILQERIEVLLKHSEPSKVARFLSACGLGSDDYLQLKDELFGHETVDSLYLKVLDFQNKK